MSFMLSKNHIEKPRKKSKPKKVVILSTSSLEDVCQCLVNRFQMSEIEVDVSVVSYNKLIGTTDIPKLDLLILALDLHTLFPEFFFELLPIHCSEIEMRCNSIIETISNLAINFNKKGVKVLINNFYYPYNLGSSIYDFQNSEGQMIWIDRLNKKLVDFGELQADSYIFNLQYYLFKYGIDRAFDLKKYYISNQLFDERFYYYLADEYSKFIKALFGPRKKCLIVDLDNTLWGGIIGEDGLDGIKLGDSYPGNIYRDIQREILQYADQGIILAVNSKNNGADVKEVFDKHPGMVVKWEDFAVKCINWNNKDDNIRTIATELNIALDSLVFIDDDPFEIEMVRQILPEVEAIKLAGEPTENLKIIQNINSLNFLTYSDEDIRRKSHYQAESRRKEFRTQFPVIEAYYKNLDMEAEIKLCDRDSVNRVAQLTQKTNQFNLTTKRYSAGNILKLMNSDMHRVYSLRLSDKFGDNGIIGVAIINTNSGSWEIDTFLLSCRVIGRTVEKTFLSYIQREAIKEGVFNIVGHYVSTNKNGLVKEFYKENGFSLKDSKWVLDNSVHSISAPEWICLST